MTYGPEFRTILVVDDNRETCAYVKKSLTAAGYGVIAATGGAEGWRVFSENRFKIKLLLTDIVMLDLGGFELADRVLQIETQLPVLFMTGGPWRGYRGLECIAKPFRSAELVSNVSRVLSANTRSDLTAPAA